MWEIPVLWLVHRFCHGFSLIITVRLTQSPSCLVVVVVVVDAAVMAVTAPNYVLEESLSNQKLWKNTAGQRPPQPVEERAFFEKMWAQNFARSQVEYKVPVEVLTATTPISLSPFADGNFDVRGGGNELSNYNLAAPPSGDNEAKKLSDAAEAALIRKLNDSMSAGIENDTLNHGVKSISSGGDTLRILVKGDNVFGTTVSKSFSRSLEKGGPIVGVDTVNISIASYRVVEVSFQLDPVLCCALLRIGAYTVLLFLLTLVQEAG